jgi:hypothetical protein
MNQEIKLKLLSTTVRPPRCATFIYENDNNWQQSLLRIIEKYSFYWGASSNLIIPTDGKRIKKEFWKILEHFDPDYLNIYMKSNRDYMKANPLEYEKIILKEVQNEMKDSEIKDKKSIYNSISEAYLISPDLIEEFEIEKSLKEELMKKLNPFYDSVEHSISPYGGSENINLKLIMKDLKEEDLFIDDFELTSNDPITELLFRSYMGSSSYIQEEKDSYSIRSIFGKEKEIEIKYNIKKIDKEKFFELIKMEENEKSQTCFKIVDKSLLLYYKNRYKHLKRNLIIVVGNSFEDFCYFYSLKSLLDCVIWLPIDIVNNYTKKDYESNKFYITRWIINKIKKYISHWSFEDTLITTSFSVGPETIQKINEILIDKKQIIGRNIKVEFKFPKELDFVFKNSLLKCEERDRKNYFVEQFIDNASVNFLNIPIPKSFRSINAIDYRWITDIKIESASSAKEPKNGYFLPSLPVFSKDFFAENVGWGYDDISTIRFTGDCISFICPNMGLIDNSNIETQTISPRIKLLNEKEIFQRVFESINYSVNYSDKGNYMRESINLFGSLEDLCDNISNENTYKMFNHYISCLSGCERRKKNIMGEHVNNRSYLHFEDIKNFIEDDIKTRKFIDNYIDKGIFYRGYILLCTKCRNADWYSFNDMGEYFICNRCKTKQIYLHENWKDPFEPMIYYKLNEVFYQGLDQNMKYPLLTLNYLKKKSNSSFIFSPELCLTDKGVDKKEIEMDVVSVCDGDLIFGEAKKNNELPKKLNKYNEICNKLNAYFVLSTFEEEWSQTNKEKVNALNWNKSPLFIGKKELLFVDNKP